MKPTTKRGPSKPDRKTNDPKSQSLEPRTAQGKQKSVSPNLWTLRVPFVLPFPIEGDYAQRLIWVREVGADRPQEIPKRLLEAENLPNRVRLYCRAGCNSRVGKAYSVE